MTIVAHFFFQLRCTSHAQASAGIIMKNKEKRESEREAGLNPCNHMSCTRWLHCKVVRRSTQLAIVAKPSQNVYSCIHLTGPFPWLSRNWQMSACIFSSG